MSRPIKPRFSTVPLAIAALLLGIELSAVRIYPFQTFYALSAQNVLIGPLATDARRLEENGLAGGVVGVNWTCVKALQGCLIGALGVAAAASVLSALEYIVWWKIHSRGRTVRGDPLSWRFGLVTPGLAVLAAVCASAACLIDLTLLGLAMDSEAVRFGMAFYLLLLGSTAMMWYAADALVSPRLVSAVREEGTALVKTVI